MRRAEEYNLGFCSYVIVAIHISQPEKRTLLAKLGLHHDDRTPLATLFDEMGILWNPDARRFPRRLSVDQ